MESSKQIDFGLNKSSTSRQTLLLEQSEWENNSTHVTKSEMYDFLLGLLTGSSSNITGTCDLTNENGQVVLNCSIYAYPSDKNLVYKLRTSYGLLGSRIIDVFECEESLVFDISDTGYLKYPPELFVSFEWVGDVYDGEGNITSPPIYSINEKDITLSKPVYGTLKVIYKTIRHEYDLTVYPREDSTKNLFDSVVYAVFTGGVSWLSLNIPDGADEIASGESPCKWTWDFDDDDNDIQTGSPPEFAPKVNKKITVDYCTQTVKNIDITYV